MADKPTRASEYTSEQAELVRATCLHVATVLGDLMDDLVVVGGLVPSLIVDPVARSGEIEPHVGTLDVDMGLRLALLGEGRYRELTGRLRDAGFAMDANAAGNRTRQRWLLEGHGSAAIDFLIPPSRADDRGGTLRDIEPDFAAIITPGLACAFQDRVRVRLEGRTVLGEKASRHAWACGPGAYVVLKALAFDARGKDKDAYDLYYVVRNFGAGVHDVARRLLPLLAGAEAQRAMAILKRDFLDQDMVGPRRVAAFLRGASDAEIQADVAGFVSELLRALEAPGGRSST